MATTPQIGSIGTRCNLLIKQGDTFRRPLQLLNPVPEGAPAGTEPTPIDLTGCQLRSQIRRKALDAAIVVTIDIAVTNAATGTARMLITPAQTASIVVGESIKDTESQFTWDLELVDSSGDVRTLLYGDCVIFREVTRA